MPLDPCRLTPAASLNRARLARDEGPGPDGAATEVTAHSLLSAAALGELIAASGSTLRPDGADGADLPGWLNARLGCPDAPTRATAERIADSYGGRLGRMLAMLHRGAPASRTGRPEWDDSYWEHWATVTQVYLGGGLARGRLGELAARSADAVLSRLTAGACTATVAAHPDLLPLVGAARSVPDGAGPALVLDIGHTAVKHAVADYQDGVLGSLHRLRSVRAPAMDAAQSKPAGALGVAEALAGIAAAAFADAASQHELIPEVIAAIAAYLDGGQPLPARGSRYSQLRAVSGDLSQWMSQQVSRRLRRWVRITLIHDGSSAARAVPADPGTAVVMLGTSLGVGYPCPGLALRPVSPRLHVPAR